MAWVQSLVWVVGSHKLHGVAKKPSICNKKKKNTVSAKHKKVKHNKMNYACMYNLFFQGTFRQGVHVCKAPEAMPGTRECLSLLLEEEKYIKYI